MSFGSEIKAASYYENQNTQAGLKRKAKQIN